MIDPALGLPAATEEHCLIRIIRWTRGTGHRAVFVTVRRFATVLLLKLPLEFMRVWQPTGGCQRKLFVHTWPCANCARSMAQSMCAPTASNDVWLEEHCAQQAIHNKQSPPVNDATCLHGVRNHYYRASDQKYAFEIMRLPRRRGRYTRTQTSKLPRVRMRTMPIMQRRPPSPVYDNRARSDWRTATAARANLLYHVRHSNARSHLRRQLVPTRVSFEHLQASCGGRH